MTAFASDLQTLLKRYPALEGQAEPLKASFELLKNSFTAGQKLLVCGNGGSAADAEHIVGELVKSFVFHRPVEQAFADLISEHYPSDAKQIITDLEEGLPAISLVSHSSLLTAFANDVAYDTAFAQQTYVLGNPGDVLMGISTSGNSPNVVLACQVAHAKGMHVIALTGESGGKLLEHADVTVRAPATEIHEVQELHLPVYHFLCLALERYFYGNNGLKTASKSSVTRKPARPFPKKLDLVVLDFDGVFTDNRVLTLQSGEEAVLCDRGDGLGLEALKKHGIPVLILTKERSPVVHARAKKLGIPCESGVDDKATFLKQHCADNGYRLENVIYMGNDTNDLEAMQCAGWGVAPSDSHPRILAQADWKLHRRGGRGAIREFVERLVLCHT